MAARAPARQPEIPDLAEQAAQRWPQNPPWSGATRLWALTFVVLVLLFLWWQVRQFTGIVVLAFLLTYLLHPLIRQVERLARVRRATATGVVYLGLAFLVLAGAMLLGRSVVAGLATVNPRAVWDSTLAELFHLLPRQVTVLGAEILLQGAYEELQGDLGRLGSLAVEAFRPAGVGWLLGAASTFAFAAFGFLVTFFTSFYLSLDGDSIVDYFERKTPVAYRPVYQSVLGEVNAVWRDFFRGQLLLALVVGIFTTVGLLALGVKYAVTLGILAGVLEVVPRLGPVLATIPAVVVALVHPSATLPALPLPVFALLVVAMYILIQFAENNVLVPRILGDSVNLPPAVMLIGALAGAAIGGVVGILLAAPILGSMRVLGSWLYYQLVRPDQAPVPVEIEGNGHQDAASALKP